MHCLVFFCWIATLVIVILTALLTPKIDWPVIMTYSGTNKGPGEPSNGWWLVACMLPIVYGAVLYVTHSTYMVVAYMLPKVYIWVTYMLRRPGKVTASAPLCAAARYN